MDSKKEANLLKDVISSNLSLESQIDAIYAITKNILDKGAFRARTISWKSIYNPQVWQKDFMQ